MIIREELLKHPVQSKAVALYVAEYAVTSDKTFHELMDCFMSADYRLAQRAAWCVRFASQKNPEIIRPYIGDLVSQLKRKEVHPAVLRNSTGILEDLEIPEEYHGEIMSLCFDFISARQTPIAVKAFAMKILFNLTRIYPEIKKELKIIIEENIDYETSAFRSRGKKFLAKL